MPHELAIKERMVRTSIYPVMFHGAEMCPPPAEDLQYVRSRVFNALFGRAPSSTPVIGLLLTRGAILDPEFVVFIRILLTCRRFLFTLDDESQYWFFRLASNFRGTLSHVRGPAAAFGFTLRQLGWTIDFRGNLTVAAFHVFSFLRVSAKRILRFATLTWQTDLLRMHTLRSKLFAFPDISRVDTIAVLNTFPCKQRKQLIREISCSFQTNNQKSRWCSDYTEQCLHCTALDSKTHRLLECPLGDEVRQPYLDLIQDIRDSGSEIPELPVVHVHPEADFLRALQFSHAQGHFGTAIHQQVRQSRVSGYAIHWFTDGSCHEPQLPVGRYSAYSIILDLCQSDAERQHMARTHQHSASTPASLAVAS